MKQLTRVFLAVFVGVLLFVGVQSLTQPAGEVGEKQITVQVIISENNEVIFEKTYRTDAVWLSEVLEEINANGWLDVTFAGSKDDPYGRFILGLGEYITEDLSTGPWWMYYSLTNQDCVEAGYCSGIDMAPVYDLDEFVFEFSN